MAAALHYELIQTRGLRFEVATAGSGKKLALLLHGFPECAHSYRHQIPWLSERGYRVWAPNLRGYGRTDRPLGRAAYTIESIEADITDLIDASGAEQIVLIGHDWGGAAAWSYAMHGPRPLDQLVILNCPHPAILKQGWLSPRQLARFWYIGFFQLPRVPEALLGRERCRALEPLLRGTMVHRERMTDADLEVYRAQASAPGALTAMLNWYRALPTTYLRSEQRGYPTIETETLLLWGERDVALRRELTTGTERYVRHLRLCFVPDASHWIQQDTPERVQRELSQFLRV